MSFLDSLFGVSKRKLKSGLLDEVCFESKGIKGRLVRVPYFFDPSNPEKKIQDKDFALDFAETLTNFEPHGEKRLFDSLTPFRDYSVDLPLDKREPMRIEFRIDRSE